MSSKFGLLINYIKLHDYGFQPFYTTSSFFFYLPISKCISEYTCTIERGRWWENFVERDATGNLRK